LVLHLHRAERADGLVDALCGLVVDPLPDPFAPEVIAVPTGGMGRVGRALAGCSYDEIAAELNVSWLTVNRQLVRARSAVRAARGTD
jgi:hypothetical protein